MKICSIIPYSLLTLQFGIKKTPLRRNIYVNAFFNVKYPLIWQYEKGMVWKKMDNYTVARNCMDFVIFAAILIEATK